MIEFDAPPRRRVRRKPLYMAALAILAISSVFAASTSLTKGTPIEFGQGVFQVKVCDTWIGVNLKTILEPNGYQGGSGGYYVNQLQIIGLDSGACSGSNLQLSLYTTGNSSPLQLFVGKTATGTTNATNVIMSVNTSYFASRKGQVELINPAGTLTRTDGYERVTPDYDANSNFDGIYDVYFTTPLALASAVNTITLQSTAQ
jgi:hypothetical protein